MHYTPQQVRRSGSRVPLQRHVATERQRQLDMLHQYRFGTVKLDGIVLALGKCTSTTLLDTA